MPSDALKLLSDSLLSVSRADLSSHNEKPSEWAKAMLLSKVVVGREKPIGTNGTAPPELSDSGFDSVSAIL